MLKMNVNYCKICLSPLADIDECEESNPCGENQYCTNTPGKYNCASKLILIHIKNGHLIQLFHIEVCDIEPA